jgi:hypothetical protein
MTPATAKKGAARYRYYVSAALNQGTNRQPGSVARVPAAAIEAAVIKALNASGAPTEAETGGDGPRDTDTLLIERQLERVTIRKDRLEVRMSDPAAGTSQVIAVPWSTSSSNPTRQLIRPQFADSYFQNAIRSESRARLVEGIAKGRYWLNQLTSGDVSDTSEIAHREDCSDRSVRMTLSLAFVSPTIVKSAIEGALPRGSGVAALTGLPTDWERQKRMIVDGRNVQA